MLQILTFIADTINTVIQFGLNMISNTLCFVRLIPQFTTYTGAMFVWLPQPFFLFATIGMSISVILFLIGRAS